MRKPVTYILSLILSAIMVFAVIGLTASLVAYINVTPDKAVELTRSNNILASVKTETDAYFQERSTASGIPANVYTDALTDDILTGMIEENIRQPFGFMSNGHYGSTESIPDLEKSIEEFYNSYADENGIKKDDEFKKSLEKAQSSAVRAVSDKCDVFKLRAMYKHGILKKAAVIYKNLILIAAGATGLVAVLVILLLIVCRKEKRSVMYWTGISALIAGAAGALPCAFLLITDHFTAFSIKQASVFTAYTVSMNRLTSAFMALSIASAAAGIALLIVYGVVCSKGKNVTPTAV